MNPFDTASPLDARYYLADREFFERLPPYVSEGAQVKYLARVEAALPKCWPSMACAQPRRQRTSLRRRRL
jgi:hypothetical protein